MKIVCASSVLRGEEAFSSLGDVTVLPEEQITQRDLIDQDLLITRSKARINAALLDNTTIRFVGCAVAGTDHIDRSYLEQAGIAWAYAPGCNANSVADYIITALLVEAERHALDIQACTLGIVGVGHIGRAVQEKAAALGFTVLLNDPPRADAEGTSKWAFIDLVDLVPAADLITVHVPYTEEGPYATRRLLDHRFFEQLGPGAILLNTSRGEIMDSEALLTALQHGMLRQAVLDVWEHEPALSSALLHAVDIGTPHIAGYSEEGRLNGTRTVYEACCRFLDTPPIWDAEMPADPLGHVDAAIDGHGLSDQDVWTRMVLASYPLLDDDQRLRDGASDDPEVMAQHFVHLRRTYPVRHEFMHARCTLEHVSDRCADAARILGFQLCR